MDLSFLKEIRIKEVEIVIKLLNDIKLSGNKLLEIGAGVGWQSKIFSDNNYDVSAIDLEDNIFNNEKIWNIIKYDGKNIPFENNFFDIIYSSNVLEHIYDFKSYQKELLRVLKDDGIAIHLLPTSSWRFWTNVTHYFFPIKVVFWYIKYYLTKKKNNGKKYLSKKRSFFDIIKLVLIPARHGTKGNALSELYYFSKSYWKKLFIDSGWNIIAIYKNNLFYTDYGLFDKLLNLKIRKILSFLFGSSCYLFILKKIK